MSTWWRGTQLVGSRVVTENLRSKTFRYTTALLLLIALAAVIVPRLLAEDRPTYTLATVGEADVALVAQLDAAAEVGDFDVEYAPQRDDEAVEDAVRSGDATAGLGSDVVYVAADSTSTFPVLVAQALVADETARRLAAAGLTAEQVAELQSVQPPEQVTVGPAGEEGRGPVGYVVGIVLYLAITFAGSAIATNVALEKATRISEVLLAVLRPSQVMVGTVAGLGLVTLVQLLVLGTPVAVAAVVSDDIGLPAAAAGDLALGVVWFALGYFVYSFVFAATAALVDKVTQVSTAILPVTTVLIGSYILSIIFVGSDPNSVGSRLISMFPLSAPMAMPIRWASGEVPVYELLLSMLLTLGAGVLLTWLASSVYRRALVVTGRRVSLREVIR